MLAKYRHLSHFSMPSRPPDNTAFWSPLASVLCLTIILLCGGLAYLPAVNGPFLLDDRSNLLFNSGIRMTELSWPAIEAAATSMSETFPGQHPWLNRPLSFISFGLNHALSDTPLAAMKLTNIALHLVNTCLVFILFRQLVHRLSALGQRPPAPAHYIALLGATIWVLHPLMVSTVLYTVQRMTELATLFSLAALISFIHYRQALTNDWRALIPGILWLACLTLLAYLSKENGVLVLCLCALLEACLFRGFKRSQLPRAARYVYWLCLALPSILLCMYLVSVYGSGADSLPRSRLFTLHERLLSQGPVLLEYLQWFVWPSAEALHFLHDDQPISRSLVTPPNTLWSWLFLLTVTVCTAILIRKATWLWLGLGFGWFFVGHLLESSVLNLELMFEHRNYLPYIGLAFCSAWMLALTLKALPDVRNLRALTGVLLASMPLLLLSDARITHWRSEQALLQHWETLGVRSGRYWTMRAARFVSEQDLPSARQALAEGHALQSGEEGFSLGQITLLCAEDALHENALLAPALAQAHTALEQPPLTSYGITQFMKMTSVCIHKQNHTQLAPLYREALRLPHRISHARAHYMLAYIAKQDGEHNTAREHLKQAQTLAPNNALIPDSLDALPETE